LVNAAGSTVVSFGTGLQLSGDIGFYGATVTAQPANINVVSGLINVGLIASGATYGVFPLSSRTLTAVTYTTFGLVPSNNVISKTVTITG